MREIEKMVCHQGYYKVFLLDQTCCTRCKNCTGSRSDCTDKREARPSPEGFAVDVFQTVRQAGYDIEVVTNNPSEINRYAILLVK